MKVLKATIEQYNSLNGFKKETSKLEFVKDINNNWIVGTEVLTDSNFEEIKSKLLELELIDYISTISEK